MVQTAEVNSIQTGQFHGVDRFEIGLSYLSKPDFLAYTLPVTHHTLMTNDGSDLSMQVLASLKSKGCKVVTLNLPGVPNPVTDNAVNLSAYTDEAVGHAMQQIQTQYGKTGGFLHLHPHFEFQHGNFAQHYQTEKDIIKAVFFIAKHIKADVNELGEQQRAHFVTVTRTDGKLGQGKRGTTSVFGGGLTGLVKCLNLEWSPVYCRALDIQPELPTQAMAQHIIAELHDPNVRIVEVGISEEGRKTTRVQQVWPQENRSIQTTVTKDSVFLVSGGARGVTASCVIEMAKAFQCKFILLGRSDFSFEVPAFAKNESDEGALKRFIMMDMKAKGEQPSLPKVKSLFKKIVAKKEIEETIQQIQAHGGEVTYVQGDVTKISSFRQELDAAVTELGAITGIIHGAGRLADKYIQDKSDADFENVLSIKLDGLLSLLGTANLNKLDHLILFSSVAGFYGNVGQTDYAIANEILSKAAHLFKTNHPKTHVSAINWGAWDSGMVSGELKAQFEAAGIKLVNSAGGPAMLVNELSKEYSDQPQTIIGGTLPAAVSHMGALRTHRIHRNLTLEENPFLHHHVIQGHAVLPVVNAVGWMAQVAESLYPDYKVFQIQDTKLFKGIVFDGKQKEDYILEIKETEKNEERISFETTILSEGKKLPTYHYRARITLVNKKSIPEAPKFSPNNSGTYTPSDGPVLYKDGSLFHGAYFQGIEEILDCTHEQIILSCYAPEVPITDQGQFPLFSINTFFADIQYQGMVVWVQKNRDNAKSLPLQTDGAVFYKEVPFGKKLFVNVAIVEATEVKMVADCTVYDEEGNVYFTTNGAVVTISQSLTW
ncbi:MAG: SDR family NAD(P)-dependent oxidoreductase [Bacteroidota bacterium]